MNIYADSNRGVYVPKYFAQTIHHDYIINLTTGISDALAYLQTATPDAEHYWDVWDYILQNIELLCPETSKTLYLYQHNDLFVGTWEEIEGLA